MKDAPDIPTNVERIDRTDASGRQWHGWQVRFYPNGARRYFSDVKHGGTTGAYAAAIAFRDANAQDKPSKIKSKGGVFLRKRERTVKDRKTTEYYVQVMHPMRGKTPPQIYVGNDNTFTKSRLRAAMQEAKAMRAKLVADHLQRTGKSLITHESE